MDLLFHRPSNKRILIMELRPIRVFLVEDNQALREEISFQLEHEGFEVRSAQDARELASLLQSDSCDVLVLDINLPGEDGFSITRRLADQKKWGIVMLTARDEIDDKLRALQDGADIYLVKPLIAANWLLASLRSQDGSGQHRAWALNGVISRCPVSCRRPTNGSSLSPRRMRLFLASFWNDKGRPVPGQNWERPWALTSWTFRRAVSTQSSAACAPN